MIAGGEAPHSGFPATSHSTPALLPCYGRGNITVSHPLAASIFPLMGRGKGGHPQVVSQFGIYVVVAEASTQRI